jgi:anti-repressor protein
MSNLIPFNYNSKEVRTITKDGVPWFVATDICEVLEIQNATQALYRLDEDERSMFNIGRQGEANIVNEYGLYNLILASRKPEAKQFKRWITHEVLPSIRKHGMYAKDELLDNPDLMIEVLTQLKKEREEKKLLESKVKELTPAAEFGNAIKNNDGLILVRDYVKVLANAGIEVRQHQVFTWMMNREYLYQNSRGDYLPNKRYIEQGLFKVIETPITSPKGSWISFTTKITGKGQEYFLIRIKEELLCLNK